MDAVVLQRADHLQPGAVADVGQTRVGLCPAEVALENPAVRRTVEQRTPALQLTDAGRVQLPGVDFGHAPVVEVLPAAHRVGEMHPPVVTIIYRRERGGDASFRHDCMSLAEQRLAHEPYGQVAGRSLDGCPQARTARTDYQHVVFVRMVLVHPMILQSVQTPIEQSRT